MLREIDPKLTSRAYAFEMWMKAPMPMVTLFGTLDVSHLRRVCRRKKMKFNMLMCYCIGKAASGIKFHHTQMDGAHAARFLARLQEEVSCLRV